MKAHFGGDFHPGWVRVLKKWMPFFDFIVFMLPKIIHNLLFRNCMHSDIFLWLYYFCTCKESKFWTTILVSIKPKRVPEKGGYLITDCSMALIEGYNVECTENDVHNININTNQYLVEFVFHSYYNHIINVMKKYIIY